MASKILAMIVLLGSISVYAQDVSAPASIETTPSAPVQVEAPSENSDEASSESVSSGSDASVSTTSVDSAPSSGSSDPAVLISEQPSVEAPPQSLPSGEENPVASSPEANPEQVPSSEVVNVTPSQDGSVGATQAPDGSSVPSGTDTPVVTQDDQNPAPESSPDAVNGNSGVSRDDRIAARDVYRADRAAARDERKEAMKKFRDDMKAARALPDGERQAAKDAARAERRAAFQKFHESLKAAREKFWAAIGRGNNESIAVGEPVKDELDNSKEEVQEQSDAQLASVEGSQDGGASETTDSAEAQTNDHKRIMASENEELARAKKISPTATRK